MIGNDIVDLSEAYKTVRSLSDRYLSKIFTSTEQEYIVESSKPKETLWLLWSMKESAYKLYMRKYQRPFYAPTKLVCSLLDNNQGTVTIKEQVYHTTSKKTDNYVHTIAHSITQGYIFTDLIKLRKTTYEEQSWTIHNKIKTIYSVKTGTSLEDISIRKTKNGVPELYAGGTKTNLAFSLSHHGQYAAIAMQNASW